MNNYDIIIVGAGPAGAQCARYIAENSKYSILLMDSTHKIGEPKKSTAGTFEEIVTEFNLPKKVIMSKIDTAVLESPNFSATIPIKGCVLEFGELKKFLAKEAVKKGVNLRIKSLFDSPIIKDKKIVGISYTKEGIKNQAIGKIIVDATGPHSVIATKLGLKKLDRKDFGMGLEYQMTNLKLKHQKTVLVRFDNDCAPGGYSWIFSTGNNKAKVGICWLESNFRKTNSKGSMKFYLDKWINSDPRLKSGKINQIHAGDAYLTTMKNKVDDNFIVIGDAGGTLNPLLGEGVRQALYSGTFAAKTIITALNKEDTSYKELSKYNLEVNNIDQHYKFLRFLSNRLYSLSNNQLNSLIKLIKDLDTNSKKRFCQLYLKNELGIMETIKPFKIIKIYLNQILK